LIIANILMYTSSHKLIDINMLEMGALPYSVVGVDEEKDHKMLTLELRTGFDDFLVQNSQLELPYITTAVPLECLLIKSANVWSRVATLFVAHPPGYKIDDDEIELDFSNGRIPVVSFTEGTQIYAVRIVYPHGTDTVDLAINIATSPEIDEDDVSMSQLLISLAGKVCRTCPVRNDCALQRNSQYNSNRDHF